MFHSMHFTISRLLTKGDSAGITKKPGLSKTLGFWYVLRIKPGLLVINVLLT